ncbi:uncharacterized protein LOC123307924 [Coccinella septempunctata]|uniref:uncharacterized protein LOC123307924 n=1 Tax=Coccinella septempunctata TaxID=41139 RepID=UPI001D08D95F|nr:uncharacterized protein LOC123307924 [Coccinella septempunctata]
MALVKGLFLMFIVIVSLATGSTSESREKLSRRVHFPMLGLGPTCNGCPDHYCDDDPAIIHGFCCGCARFYDNLPVQCSTRIHCPMNGYGLCQDYEYMMHCCC